MFSLIKKWSSVCYIAVIMLVAPCEGSKAVSFHRHEVKTVSKTSRGDPGGGNAGAPPGSPAYIRAHPPPPLCVGDAKVHVYVGEDNLRTFTTTSGSYWSDEAMRNKVRCKGALPSQKCLPVELRKGKADKEASPPLGLIAAHRRSGSLRSVLMDAIEGPVPVGHLPTEASISHFGKSADLAAQPPNPETKPADMKGFKPGLDVSPGVPQQSPVHPAAKNVEKPVVPNGSMSKAAVQGEVSARGNAAQSADFSSQLSTVPCTSVPYKECPCAQDNDRPLLWAPSQSLVQKVEAVSLAVPEQKNRDLKKDPLHILVLGVGTGALSMSVLNNCRVFVPGGLKVESVEPDQSIATVAQNLFGFKGISGVHKLEVSSCGLALDARMKDGNSANGGKYDVVIINIFNGDDTVPTQCRNQTFLGQVKSVVKDQGVVMQSVHNKELAATLSDYTNIFGYKVRKDSVSAFDGKNGSYHIIVAGDLDLVKSGTALPSCFGFAVAFLAMSVMPL